MALTKTTETTTKVPSRISGRVKVDERTKRLVQRLRRGDIALIHHADLDSVAARSLIDAGVSAVLNAARSITGRYPAYGARMLLDSKIPLIDELGDEFFNSIKEGDRVAIEGDAVLYGGGRQCKGNRVTVSDVDRQIETAKANVGAELEAFAKNTLNLLEQEWRPILEPLPLPEPLVHLARRHAVVVARGPGFKEDLAALRRYMQDSRPAIIAVDGAAQALLDIGIRPDLIVGDLDSVSDQALRCGARIWVHGYSQEDRPSPGMAVAEEKHLDALVVRSLGTSEDLAMLIAYELDCPLIVTVGCRFALEEFLDKGRSGMASTFLVRLKVGSRLVDAKGVGRLYSVRKQAREIVWLFLAALCPVAVALAFSPTGQFIVKLVRNWWRL
ncbi:MAG: DUF115 domain-containing protein [Armatimonadetes bacterium]|nr:DUF115 domain-containing protein [Armatimonadota bacterium]